MNKIHDNTEIVRESYESYMQSKHWAALRLSVLRPNEMCWICRDKPAEQAHHRVYRNFYDVTPDDLIATCQPCHSAIHDAMNKNFVAKDASAQVLREHLFPKENEVCLSTGTLVSSEIAEKSGFPDLAGKRVVHRYWLKLHKLAYRIPSPPTIKVKRKTTSPKKLRKKELSISVKCPRMTKEEKVMAYELQRKREQVLNLELSKPLEKP